jgi:exonuclease VII small subunit
MNITRIVIFSIFITLSPTGKAEVINFCNDPKVNQEWERLIKKNNKHPEWRSMYKLRKELCASVDSGKVTLEKAIEQFESEREVLVIELRKRLERKHGRQIESV